MAILDMFNKPMFASRFKLPVHLIQAVLITVVIGLSVPRLFMKNQPRTRSSTIALGMGAKSLIILAYMLLAEHVESFKKWHSYKANVILSCLEIVFWGAVAFLCFQANLKQCTGIMCTLSWVVVGLAVVINHLEIWSSGIAIREFREYRKGGKGVPLTSVNSMGGRRANDDEEMIQPKQGHAQGGWQPSQGGQQYPQQPQQGRQQYGRSDRDQHQQSSVYSPPQYSQNQQYNYHGSR
ncbi:hypothetical protein BKA66DRAFT_445997 [Pyrenochaeta sp. MPI-SDFR-AT-0127]|nr:hypothetical protein BKA66DRAFT_445997 [Pyrenochaeta sp. MPI-SDFR-AT-0127]